MTSTAAWFPGAARAEGVRVWSVSSIQKVAGSAQAKRARIPPRADEHGQEIYDNAVLLQQLGIGREDEGGDALKDLQ